MLHRHLRLLSRRWQPCASFASTTSTTTSSSFHALPPIKPVSPELNIDFSGKNSFKTTKTTGELARALMIYRICAIPVIVKNSSRILNRARKMLGDWLVLSVVKHSFFAHFCGGETSVDIQPRIRALEKLGIRSILDFAAEAHIDGSAAGESAGFVTQAMPVVTSEFPHTQTQANIVAAGIAADMALPLARTFPIDIEEAECDANVAIFKDCVMAAAQFEEGFAAIKVTALGRPALLEKMTKVIRKVRELFSRFARNKGNLISQTDFTTTLAELGVGMTEEEAIALFKTFDKTNSGFIDFLRWTEHLQPENIATKPFFVETSRNNGNRKNLLPTLTADEMVQCEDMMRRLSEITEVAAKHRVRLMVDAEQSYFQPAISHTVVNLQRKFNREFPVVFNTYQAYMKNSYGQVQDDLDRATREGFVFAAKLVRGAYLAAERARAAELGYEDPIWPSIENTHSAYNHCLDLILRNTSNGNIMVASHNPESVKLTISLMRHYKIKPTEGRVFFGQLLGMADSLSLTLGANQYAVYKYVPYGPLKEVIPYLLRRAEENSTLLGSEATQKERDLLWHELKKRIWLR